MQQWQRPAALSSPGTAAADFYFISMEYYEGFSPQQQVQILYISEGRFRRIFKSAFDKPISLNLYFISMEYYEGFSPQQQVQILYISEGRFRRIFKSAFDKPMSLNFSMLKI